MLATVEFHGEQLEFYLHPECLSGEWHGPTSLDLADVGAEISRRLETPRSFPSLRQAVVPGDRVVIALDPQVPQLHLVLAAICDVLSQANVDRGDITVLATGEVAASSQSWLPAGVVGEIHDPDDRDKLAYLATTEAGRRVYLNRKAVDADFLMTVGRLGHDLMLGPQGPWSTLFPALSDTETLQAFRAGAGQSRSASLVLKESAEVGWLVGNQFQVGVMAGANGVASVIAGLAEAVRDDGLAEVSRSWAYRIENRVDLVIAGVGEAGKTAGLIELASAVGAAAGLVRRGGKIVILSRAEGEPGAALQRLMNLDDPHEALPSLKDAEGEPDYPVALEIARALTWADVYILSRVSEETIDSLGLIPLSRPEEALRLAKSSPSVVLLSRAEQTRTSTAEDDQ